MLMRKMLGAECSKTIDSKTKRCVEPTSTLSSVVVIGNIVIVYLGVGAVTFESFKPGRSDQDNIPLPSRIKEGKKRPQMMKKKISRQSLDKRQSAKKRKSSATELSAKQSPKESRASISDVLDKKRGQRKRTSTATGLSTDTPTVNDSAAKQNSKTKRNLPIEDQKAPNSVLRPRKHHSRSFLYYQTKVVRRRCGKCLPCTQDYCGTCCYCQDMPRFGGKGKVKQSCVKRQCLNLQ